MKERLYKILNIKHSESIQVFDLLTVQFFIGLANALISIIAFTLFVYNFPVDYLPLVYLVIAGVLIMFNFIYEKLEHRFSPLQLIKYITGFAVILMIFLWIGLTYGNKDHFIFMLLVCSVLIYMITGYAFWGLVSLLFNVRESRRIFSIVGSGDIPAKLIGYIAAPLLIPFVGLNNLIWLAVLSMGISLLLFSRYIKKKNWETIKQKFHKEDHHVEDVFNKKDFVSFFFKNRLIFAISLLSLISYNVFVLIDFTFISQVKLRFENITDLAAYIALFFAFGRVIALTFKLIFTSRVIERLGVIYCLFITPIVLFLFCMLFFAFGDQSKYTLFIFGLMAMITEVLRSTMQEPVFFILFQPLKEKLRLKGHIISKGYMYPPSLIIVGVSLLLLYRSGAEMSIMFAIKLLIVNLCIWAGIIFLIGRTYLNTIHASIRKGIFTSDDIYITDNNTIEILLNKIEKGDKTDVIYALNLLQKSGYPGFNELLEKKLREGNDIAVKKFALELSESAGKISLDVLRNMLFSETDAELKQKVISLLCKHDPEFLKEASENISHNEYAVRKIIVINLLNQREFNYLFIAGNEINSLLYSSVPAERELAIEIISDVKHVQFSDALAALIADDDISVKRAAISTICKLRLHKLIPSIINLLDQPADRNLVLKGLQLYGDDLFEDINNIEGTYVSDFVKIAARVKGPYSTAFLLSHLDDNSDDLRNKIVHALWAKEYEFASSGESEKLGFYLNIYLKLGLDKIRDYHNIPEFKDKDIIKRAIFSEVKNDLSLSLKIAVLLYRKKEINRILELMEIDKHDKLYNAMEMLELLLPKRISKDMNLIFDFILDPAGSIPGNMQQEINIFYNKVIFNSPMAFNPWTKAVCVYSSWRNNQTDFLMKLKDNQQPDLHYLVKETKDYVIETQKNKS